MKVLVLGGTGAIGTYLVSLLADEADVFVTTRQNRRDYGKVRYLCGNALDTVFLGKILQQKWDAIVDFMSYSTSVFSERMPLYLNATAQYVFLSSSRVYSDTDNPITENTPRLIDVSHDQQYLLTDEYALAKARQEDLLKKSLKRNWTIVRPYITYSNQRLQLGVFEKENWLYRALHGRTIVFSKEIAQKTTTLTFGRDVAQGIKGLVGENRALGEIFHITANETITWQEVMETYIDVIKSQYGITPKVLYCDLEQFITCHHATYQIIYDRLYNRCFDNSKISAFTAACEFMPPKTGLTQCLEEFLRSPSFRAVDWYAEARKDRITRERASIREIPQIKQKAKYLLYRYTL